MSKKSSISASILKYSLVSIALVSVGLNFHYYGRVTYYKNISNETYVNSLLNNVASYEIITHNYENNITNLNQDISDLKVIINQIGNEKEILQEDLKIAELRLITLRFNITCVEDGREALEIVITNLETETVYTKDLYDGMCQIKLENNIDYSCRVRTYKQLALYQWMPYDRTIRLDSENLISNQNWILE